MSTTSNENANNYGMTANQQQEDPSPQMPPEDCVTKGYSYEDEVIANKELRVAGDAIIQTLKKLPSSRERSLAITKFQEGVMWIGMDLKRLGEANPYPNSYNPSNTKIEPTADGLKL